MRKRYFLDIWGKCVDRSTWLCLPNREINQPSLLPRECQAQCGRSTCHPLVPMPMPSIWLLVSRQTTVDAPPTPCVSCKLITCTMSDVVCIHQSNTLTNPSFYEKVEAWLIFTRIHKGLMCKLKVLSSPMPQDSASKALSSPNVQFASCPWHRRSPSLNVYLQNVGIWEVELCLYKAGT